MSSKQLGSGGGSGDAGELQLPADTATYTQIHTRIEITITGARGRTSKKDPRSSSLLSYRLRSVAFPHETQIKRRLT
jgi:hypothetical protein